MDRSRLAELEHEANGSSADLTRLLQDRYTCRAYLPRPVPHDVIESILEIAQFSPSWCNTQPWKLYITQGAATQRFAKGLYAHATSGTPPMPDFEFPTQYRDVYDVRRKSCAAQLYGSLGIARDDRAGSMRQTMENFRLFDAPHAAIVTTPADLGIYGAIDCGLFVSNFLLAAGKFGVATTPQAALAAYAPFVRSQLAIPDDRLIVCGISFGYADEAHPANAFRTDRGPIENMVEFRED